MYEIAMRIFLDAKDLIDVVEHDRPMSVIEFDTFVRDRGATLVLGNAPILQFVAPLVRDKDFPRMRSLLQQLETLPVEYLADGRIPQVEIEAAITAYRENREPERLAPFGSRWDDTWFWPRQPLTRMLVNMPLEKFIFAAFSEDPSLLALSPAIARMRSSFANYRSSRGSTVEELRVNFAQTIWRKITDWHSNGMWTMPITQQESLKVGYWIHDRISRCPSLRFSYECYFELMKNKTDIPKDDDLTDFIYVGAVPYVDFVTLDKRMLHYARSAASRLEAEDKALQFGGRMFPNLTGLVAHLEQ